MLQILFSLTSYLPSSPVVIPFAKLSANLLSLSLVLSSDQKRFHRCNMFYPTTRHASIVVIRFAQRFRSFFPANNKDFVFVICCTQRPKLLLLLLHVLPNEQKHFHCFCSFCPTNNNAFVLFVRFTESSVLLILITQRLISHCRLQSQFPTTSSASVRNIVSVVYYQFSVHDIESLVLC